ncbi:MAG: hypothetical protein JJU13_10395 [Balneolaceae bacterium]|nr:hypothetical protein [Balneolaceae bacterium]
MKKSFSHIFRSLTISVLMTGILAHMILPFSSQAQKTAFTQWLSHNVVASGDENEIKLRNSIRELPEKSGNFWILIEQASELVANHKDDFRINLALPDNNKNQQVSSWLLGQWNVFQTQKAGTNAILPDISQPFYKWLSTNNFTSVLSSQKTDHLIKFYPGFVEPVLDTVSGRSLIPLISGISINAP